MKHIILIALAVAYFGTAQGQNAEAKSGLWTELKSASLPQVQASTVKLPQKYCSNSIHSPWSSSCRR
jgi:hypothetical protein